MVTKSQPHLESKRLSSELDGSKHSSASDDSGRVMGAVVVREEAVTTRRMAMLEAEDLVSSSQSEESDESEAETPEEPPEEKKPTKPQNTRVLLEVEQLRKVFDQIGCPKCGSAISLNLRTVCVATSTGFECTKVEKCKFFYHPEQPSPTTMHFELEDNFERTTDYGINVLYVLGFISMGDGPTEAARLLGLLGLPNDTTMESRSFGIVEERIGPFLRELCNEIIRENLIEEARQSMAASSTQDELDFKLCTKICPVPTPTTTIGHGNTLIKKTFHCNSALWTLAVV
jgi:hypothetical protein